MARAPPPARPRSTTATSSCSSVRSPTTAGASSSRPSSSCRARSASPSGSASGRSRRPCRTPGPCRSSAPSRSRGSCAPMSPPGRPASCACRRPWSRRSSSRSSRAGIPSLGYFAQVPHYISGPYPAASVALLETLGQHLGVSLPPGDLADEAEQLRSPPRCRRRVEETTRTYVERLESMVDEQRLPAGRRPDRRHRAIPARPRRREHLSADVAAPGGAEPARSMTKHVTYCGILPRCGPVASSTCCSSSRPVAG